MFPRDKLGIGTSRPLGFGLQTQNTSSFGQNNSFNKPPASGGAFGNAPAFGQASGSSLLPGQSSNLGQGINTLAPGTANIVQSGFGTVGNFDQAHQASSGSLFGASTFSQQNQPISLGFSTPHQSGSFGQQQPHLQQGSSPFQSSNASSLFGQSTSFGRAVVPKSGTGIKFKAVDSTDIHQKNGVTSSINTKLNCITCMTEYEDKSLEELRYEDYLLNYNGAQQVDFGVGSPGSFLMSQATNNHPSMGQDVNISKTPLAFGQPNTGCEFQRQDGTTSALFGKQGTDFGKSPNNITAFGLYANASSSVPQAQNQQSSLFSTPAQSLCGSSNFQSANLLGSSATQSNSAGTNFFSKLSQPVSLIGSNQSSFSLSQPTVATSGTFQSSKSPSGLGLPIQPSGIGTTTGSKSALSQQQFSLGSNSFSFSKTASSTFPPLNQAVGTTFGTTPGLIGNMNAGGNLFSGSSSQTTCPLNIQPKEHQQQFMTFPSSEPVDYRYLFNDQFPISPHLSNLQPISRTEPMKDRVTAIDFNTNLGPMWKIDNTCPKLTVIPVKRLCDKAEDSLPNYIINNQKRLIIKNTKEDERSIFCDPDEELLAEIYKTRPELLKKLEPNGWPSDEAMARSKSSVDVKCRSSDPITTVSRSSLKKADELNNSIGARVDSELKILTEENTSCTPETVKQVACPKGRSRALSLFVQQCQCLTCVDSSQRPDQDAKLTDSTPSKDQTTKKEDPVDSDPQQKPIQKTSGVVLTRPDYYTVPSLKELDEFVNDDGSCLIRGFTVGRVDYGNVYFPDLIDVSNLNLDEIVFFNRGEVTVYLDDAPKPPLNEGLNRSAQVTLDHVYPSNIESVDKAFDWESQFIMKLKSVCARQGSEFLNYRSKTGSWVFNVEHFSAYFDAQYCDG